MIKYFKKYKEEEFMKIPTPHIGAKTDDIAKTVLMPGAVTG